MELLRCIRIFRDGIVHLWRRLSSENYLHLGDPNRPLRLAEKFQDIYDNSYMDLRSYLTEECHKPEKEAIIMILWTLKDISKYYFHKNRIDQENLEIIEYQDEQACRDLASVQFLLQNGGGVRADIFIKECREICKLMCIPDSCVFLCFGFKSGGSFDTDVLTHYTTPGEKVDYLVWPAIYEHEQGTILSKGVAKAKARKIDSML